MVIGKKLFLTLVCLLLIQTHADANSPASQRKIFAKDKNPHYYLAEKYREEKKYDQARAEFSILIDAEPNDVGYRISRGQVEIHMKDYRGALADAEKLITLTEAPYFRFLASEIRAKAYAGLNRTSEAITEYTNALKTNPTEPDAQLHLGRLLFKAKRYDEALVPLRIARSQFQQMTRKTAPYSANEATAIIEKIEKIQAKSRSKKKDSNEGRLIIED